MQMGRFEAWHILCLMEHERKHKAEKEALGIAMDSIEFIDMMPEDMVPVVRCKDCKHYELDACLKIYQDGNVSNDAWQERKPTDFCSYGDTK